MNQRDDSELRRQCILSSHEFTYQHAAVLGIDGIPRQTQMISLFFDILYDYRQDMAISLQRRKAGPLTWLYFTRQYVDEVYIQRIVPVAPAAPTLGSFWIRSNMVRWLLLQVNPHPETLVMLANHFQLVNLAINANTDEHPGNYQDCQFS